MLAATEPSWTDPGEDIVQAVWANAREVLGREVVANSRPGFSDARFYRHAGLSSIVYGVSANNMGTRKSLQPWSISKRCIE